MIRARLWTAQTYKGVTAMMRMIVNIMAVEGNVLSIWAAVVINMLIKVNITSKFTYKSRSWSLDNMDICLHWGYHGDHLRFHDHVPISKE